MQARDFVQGVLGRTVQLPTRNLTFNRRGELLVDIAIIRFNNKTGNAEVSLD